MRVPKRTFINMSITLALALTLSLPGLFLVLHQAQTSGGVNWLRDYWLATPPALAIPKSLALLALGGNMPRYLLALPLSRPMQLLALGLTALAVGAFFWPRKVDSNPPVETQNPGIEPAQLRRLLMVFTFWPLVFIWCYSELSTPIYLVGRYDLFAQPAYLVLVALGLTRLQNACTAPPRRLAIAGRRVRRARGGRKRPLDVAARSANFSSPGTRGLSGRTVQARRRDHLHRPGSLPHALLAASTRHQQPSPHPPATPSTTSDGWPTTSKSPPITINGQ